MKDFLTLGKIGRPHGIKGELGVEWLGEADPPQNIWLATGNGAPKEARIVARRKHNGRLLLTLEGIDSRTEAEKLKGLEILVKRDSIRQPEDDEAFVEDLPGSEVFLPDGSRLGILKRVDFPAGQMVWAIEDNEKNEILFPAQPCFIISLDVVGRRIVIDPPEGLLEIYRA